MAGKQIYTPVVFKLEPGESLTSTKGKFYGLGWGIVAFIKDDALSFYGWDGACRHSTIDIYKWGCEDVMFVRKLADKGMYAIRGNVSGLVHYTLTGEEKHKVDSSLPHDWNWKKYDAGENTECYASLVDYSPIVTIPDREDHPIKPEKEQTTEMAIKSPESKPTPDLTTQPSPKVSQEDLQVQEPPPTRKATTSKLPPKVLLSAREEELKKLRAASAAADSEFHQMKHIIGEHGGLPNELLLQDSKLISHQSKAEAARKNNDDPVDLHILAARVANGHRA